MQTKTVFLIILLIVIVLFFVKSVDTFYNEKSKLKVKIERSGSNTKTIKLADSIKLSHYRCPEIVSKSNWDKSAAGWDYNDTFQIEQNNEKNEVTVTRTDTDSDGGWGMDLVFDCPASDLHPNFTPPPVESSPAAPQAVAQQAAAPQAVAQQAAAPQAVAMGSAAQQAENAAAVLTPMQREEQRWNERNESYSIWKNYWDPIIASDKTHFFRLMDGYFGGDIPDSYRSLCGCTDKAKAQGCKDEDLNHLGHQLARGECLDEASPWFGPSPWIKRKYPAAGNKYIVSKLDEDKSLIEFKEEKATQTELNTMLSEDVIRFNLENVKLMIDKGADVNAKTGYKGLTALHYAVRGEDRGTDIVEFLLKKGADVNAKTTSYDYTPLHYAAWYESRQRGALIKLLLGVDGINVNAKNKGGVTPIQWAAERGNTNADSVQILACAGADLKGVDLKKLDIDLSCRDAKEEVSKDKETFSVINPYESFSVLTPNAASWN